MALKSAYLTGILAHIPEAERGKAETELAALEAGGLKQEDYSRLANEATAAKKAFDDLHEKNVAWFEEKREALASIDTLKAERDALAAKVAAGGTSTTIPADVITKADLEKTLDLQERGAVGFFTELNNLSLQHFQQFGEILDTTKLLADKRVQQIGLRGVYAEAYKEPLAAKAKAAADAQADALRKEGYEKARTEMAGARHPYPVVGNEPSALDAIEAARTGTAPVVKSVDDMASEYARLAGARSS